jgi:hypothetical protein
MRPWRWTVLLGLVSMATAVGAEVKTISVTAEGVL